MIKMLKSSLNARLIISGLLGTVIGTSVSGVCSLETVPGLLLYLSVAYSISIVLSIVTGLISNNTRLVYIAFGSPLIFSGGSVAYTWMAEPAYPGFNVEGASLAQYLFYVHASSLFVALIYLLFLSRKRFSKYHSA